MCLLFFYSKNKKLEILKKNMIDSEKFWRDCFLQIQERERKIVLNTEMLLGKDITLALVKLSGMNEFEYRSYHLPSFEFNLKEAESKSNV